MNARTNHEVFAANVSGDSMRQAPVPGTQADFRLGDLVATPLNVRTTPRPDRDIRAMAASIQVYGGVLQNLIVVPMLDELGAWTGKFGAVAGETRRLALCLLRDGGIEGAVGFSDDTLVPCRVIAHPHAVAASLTENVSRNGLHPADQFVAFKTLVDACGDVEQVAAVYGVTPAVVERRLRLANAAPKLFKLYRDGGMELEQLMTLCVSEDHVRQARVWKAARSAWDRRPERLREQMTMGRLSLVSDPIGKFVGVLSYEAAGCVHSANIFLIENSHHQRWLFLFVRPASVAPLAPWRRTILPCHAAGVDPPIPPAGCGIPGSLFSRSGAACR